MKILICGGEGQLAKEFTAYFKEHHPSIAVAVLSEEDLDVTQPVMVAGTLEKLCPDIVINTAAYHQVNECETNVKQTLDVNTFGGFLVVQKSKEIGARSMYFSTGYVFDGLKQAAYGEDDQVNPINIYGHSKALGEKFIKEVDENAWIVRTNGLYGVYSNKKTKGGKGNFVDFVLKNAREGKDLEMVADQYITPTWTKDLAEACVSLILDKEDGGIYHLTNSGETTWFEVAKNIYSLVDAKGEVLPISTKERNETVLRPKNALLADMRWEKLKKTSLPRWEESVRQYVQLMGH